MDILVNPIVLSVIAMSILCLLRFNVLLSVIVASLVAGLAGGMSVTDTIESLIGGMGGNSETALSYILLGALATVIGRSGLATVVTKKITNIVGTKKVAFTLLIAFVACFSQNLIPVHIAFIPILIPPLVSGDESNEIRP